ncbi:protein lin-54 homolog isoform X2 [Lepeophtheirus salmonis]|uniref:CRC domain-containing protein n=1 Tax=Lepeophtheirus salmonis TaxID=72036 RepID=A0A0K2T0G5_LEPSM|nr:protein lin-54 homolog isoform X2 [Lepeophtheirus salmonis]
MEAGKETKSTNNPGEDGLEDVVKTLYLDAQEAKSDEAKSSEDLREDNDVITVPKSTSQPTIRLAKSLQVHHSNILKPMASWKPLNSSSISTSKETTVDSTSGIKILSPYSSSSRLPQQVKIIKGNETRQLSLAQATELGLMISSSSNSSPIKTTQVIKSSSPIKPLLTSTSGKASPKAIVIGSQNSSGKQVIIQPGSDSQRIIRLPPQPNSSSSASNIIQLNSSKVQYVKVALPPNNKSQVVSSESLKIALPPSSKSVQQRKILPAQRVILPTSPALSSPGSGGASSRYLPIAPLIEFKDQEDGKLVLENLSSTPSTSSSSTSNIQSPAAATLEVSSGVRLRKPCNCSKSQCLKLYCECFANGKFCYNCNCFNCYNNIKHEEDRQRSIRSCLERNPNAFRPKIGRGGNNEGERVHHKGCNCKRSSCLKNYCECYEAKIPCTEACRCVACKNVEEFSSLSGSGSGPTVLGSTHNDISVNKNANTLTENLQNSNSNTHFEEAAIAEEPTDQQIILPMLKKEIKPSLKSKLTPFISLSNESPKVDKKSFNFVTNEVISATCQCLLTQAEEAEKNELSESQIEGLILEEFGRCLKQIIDISKKP